MLFQLSKVYKVFYEPMHLETNLQKKFDGKSAKSRKDNVEDFDNSVTLNIGINACAAVAEDTFEILI